MSSSSHQSAVLVDIIGESVLQERIIKLLGDLGVSGYTLSQVQGAGSHGTRRADLVGYNTNFEIKTIVSPAVSDAILNGLAPHQLDHALIAFRQKVENFSGFAPI